MGLLGNLKQKLSGSMNKYSGNKDFLEAVCAAASLVAGADGKIEDSEIDGAIKAVTANEKLNMAFNSREIEACMNRMITRTNGGRVGQLGLYSEIEDVAGKDAEMAEVVLLTALDISDSDGSIDPSEQKVLEKIAAKLSLDLKKYL